jgi:predicted site-specific integrase-resolvase
MERTQQIIENINLNPIYRSKLSLNTHQASELIGVSPNTLENWRKEGIGPEYIKMGGKRGRVMYPKIAIAEFLAQTVKTA